MSVNPLAYSVVYSAVPCVGSLAFFMLLFGFIIIMRYMSYKQTLKLAEKGIVIPERKSDGKGALRWGIVITALALALCIGLYPIGFLDGRGRLFPFNFGPWMLFGLIPLFLGIALIIIYVATRDKKSKNEAAMTTTNSG